MEMNLKIVVNSATLIKQSLRDVKGFGYAQSIAFL